MRLAFEHQHSRRHPGSRPRAKLDPCRARVEVGIRRVLEAGALQPDPALGVLGAPVVADHPRPAVELNRLAADVHAAVEAGVREEGDELRLWQSRLVEAVGWEVLAGLGVAGECELPRSLDGIGVEGAHRPTGADLRAIDLDPRAARHRQRGRRHGDLGRLRPLRLAVEEDKPDRGVGLGSRALVNRVADPDPLATSRPAGLDVKALVVARLGGDLWEPRSLIHWLTLHLDGYDVAVLDDVIPTLDAEHAAIAAGGVAPTLDQLLPADHLGFDEGFLDLGMDRSRRLEGGGAALQRPRDRFLVFARGEEGDQLEQVIGGADQAIQTRAIDPIGLPHLLRFGRIELGKLTLDPRADRDNPGADCRAMGGTGLR